MNSKEINRYVNNLKSFCSRDTCYSKIKNDWTIDNPFFGHCAIITLCVFEKFGGKIKRGIVKGQNISHYWNEINGQDYDFTYEQFANPVEIEFIGYKSKDDLLSDKDFAKRYKKFKERAKGIE